MRFGKIENNLLPKSFQAIFAFLILCNCVFSIACQTDEERYDARLKQCVELGHTKLDDSVICLENLVKSNPNKGITYLFLARNYEDLGQIDKAEQAIEVFVQSYPLDASGHQVYCQILMEKGDLSNAATECMEAIQIQPKDISIRLTMADVQEKRGEFELAEIVYEGALEISPNNALALVSLAGFYERRGKLDEAITTLEKLIELKPDNYKKIEEGIKKLKEKRELQQIREEEIKKENPKQSKSRKKTARTN